MDFYKCFNEKKILGALEILEHIFSTHLATSHTYQLTLFRLQPILIAINFYAILIFLST